MRSIHGRREGHRCGASRQRDGGRGRAVHGTRFLVLGGSQQMIRALVAEDDPDIRTTLVAMLERLGVAARVAGPGWAALEDVRAGGFDLLVTDVFMPEVDGLALIRELRAAGKAAAVIAISGGSSSMSADLGLQLSEAFGADKVLFKPFSLHELAAAVGELFPATRGPSRGGGRP